MAAPHGDEIVAGYMARLQAALRDKNPSGATEIEADVRAHISEARAGLPQETDADVLNLLDRLGDPETLVADAAAGPGMNLEDPGPGAARATRSGRAAVLVLLAGAVAVLPFGIVATLPGVAFLLAGLIVARRSGGWAVSEVNSAGFLSVFIAVGVVVMAILMDRFLVGSGIHWVFAALIVNWSLALVGCAAFLQWASARDHAPA